jgi:hypothetical protein
MLEMLGARGLEFHSDSGASTPRILSVLLNGKYRKEKRKDVSCHPRGFDPNNGTFHVTPSSSQSKSHKVSQAGIL